MNEITKLNEQINDTTKMIESTKELLVGNEADEMLLFMLRQDEVLLNNLKKERRDTILRYLNENVSNASDLIDLVYTKTPMIVDPIHIAESLGIKVIKSHEIADNEAGKCYINDDIVIEYKPQNVSHREKFSVAHELGHIVKHMSVAANNTNFTDTQELLYARNNYYDSLNPEEKEADAFAGSLLVPDAKLNFYLESLQDGEQISAKLLADIFKVAEGTIYHVLRSRGLYSNPKILKDFSWV